MWKIPTSRMPSAGVRRLRHQLYGARGSEVWHVKAGGAAAPERVLIRGLPGRRPCRTATARFAFPPSSPWLKCRPRTAVAPSQSGIRDTAPTQPFYGSPTRTARRPRPTRNALNKRMAPATRRNDSRTLVRSSTVAYRRGQALVLAGFPVVHSDSAWIDSSWFASRMVVRYDSPARSPSV